MANYIFKQESYRIFGCAMEVHKELGNGFLEAVYQEALTIEFNDNDIPFEREYELPILYKDNLLKKKYFPDFFCFDQIVVELKAVSELNDNHLAQVFNYLKASKQKLGLLINFGAESLEYKRIIK